MQSIKVSKTKLIEILNKNRSEHRDIFLAAQNQYRKVVIEVLDEQLQLARDGKPFVLAIIVQLVSPEDHTREYDRAIRMLELSLDETVTLSEAEFMNLVQDIWNWSRSWAASNSTYVSSPKFQAIE